MKNGCPMSAIRRVPADHDTQACVLGPTLFHFFLFRILSWVVYCGYTRPRFFFNYYLRAWHRCDREQSQRPFMNSGSQKNKTNISFHLVKSVTQLFYALFLDWLLELASGVPVLPLWLIFTSLFWNIISAKAGHITINTRLLIFFRLYWGG